jgi:hypothetical protein
MQGAERQPLRVERQPLPRRIKVENDAVFIFYFAPDFSYVGMSVRKYKDWQMNMSVKMNIHANKGKDG